MSNTQLTREQRYQIYALLKMAHYLTGETLDVKGLCGRYNLQFAFRSEVLAGKAADSEAECQG